jgi:hypothetical protein
MLIIAYAEINILLNFGKYNIIREYGRGKRRE